MLPFACSISKHSVYQLSLLGEGKDLKHSIKMITTCDTSDLIGQGLPDCDIKKTTSSRNIGVVLSRKSEANSTTTGNSVSSSNNCLVCEEDN